MSQGGELFDPPLAVDPTIALPAPPTAPLPAPGPRLRTQFVIELVGPRSVPAAAGAQLLQPPWNLSLSSPQLFCMRASDPHWVPLTSSTDGAYDSLALAWDLLATTGQLTSIKAADLLNRCEEYAGHLQRRAIPMPLATEVDQTVYHLKQIRDMIDVGCSLAVIPSSGSCSEESLWRLCAGLGLSFHPRGEFVWKSITDERPLLHASPLGPPARFSLSGVQGGQTFEGMNVGFLVGHSPSPVASLQALLHVTKVAAARLEGWSVDENGDIATPSTEMRLQAELNQALILFEQARVRPGSPDAFALWPESRP